MAPSWLQLPPPVSPELGGDAERQAIVSIAIRLHGAPLVPGRDLGGASSGLAVAAPAAAAGGKTPALSLLRLRPPRHPRPLPRMRPTHPAYLPPLTQSTSS